jgi:hypothetical protein
MRHGRWEGEVMPGEEVRGVSEQPRPDLANLRCVCRDEHEEHRVVDGEDPQESASVELPYEEQPPPRFPQLKPADQDSRDQEPAQDKEQTDPEHCPLHLTQDRYVRRLPIVRDDDAHDGEEAKRVELRHVPTLASRRSHAHLEGLVAPQSRPRSVPATHR